MSTQPGTIELTGLLPDWDDEPNCDHSEHGKTPTIRHRGPARWATTTKCRACKTVFQGLRCDQWRTWLLTTRAVVWCATCGHTCSSYDYYQDTHWREL